MKQKLVNQFGPFLGILALTGIVIGYTLAPASCALKPDQVQRLQSIAVPAASLGLAYAQAQGYIVPGDRITLTQGVAVVVSDKTPEAKLFDLAEIGLKEAVSKGLLSDGQTVTLKSEDIATITTPATATPVNPLLPAP